MITTNYYFQDCRDGFNHIGILLNDGEIIQTAKIHYINRTWESYDGQTARKEVCRKYLRVIEERNKERAKKATGRARMCEAVKMEFSRLMSSSELYKEVQKHLETL